VTIHIQKSDFAIVGSGAVGSLFALILSKNDATVKFLDFRRAKITSKIIFPEGLLKKIFRNSVEIEQLLQYEEIQPAILIISTKYSKGFSAGLFDLIHKLDESVPVLLFQNSYSHVRDLRHQFPNRFIVGMLSQLEVLLVGEKLTLARTPFCLNLPSQEKEISKSFLFEKSIKSPILKLLVSGSEEEVIWNKLARWVPLSAVTTVCRLPIGESLQIFPRRLLSDLIDETCLLAQAEGGGIFEPSAIIDQINRLPHSLVTSSMRDRLGGRTTEVTNVLKDMERDLLLYNLPNAAVKSMLELLQ